MIPTQSRTLTDKKKILKRNHKKRASSWFRSEGKYSRSGSLVVSLVSISDLAKLPEEALLKRQTRRSLVISVPRVCGSAVQRNRFRRIVRAQLKKHLKATLPEKKGLWIRLQNDYRLPRNIHWEQWSLPIENALKRLGL